MLHTNPEFIYELKIGIAALQRACYEVIGACSQIEYSIRLLQNKDTGGASSGQHVVIPTNTDGDVEQPTAADSNPSFTPTTKSRSDKGDPLAELAAQLSPQDREKLISAMEGGKK